MPYLKGRGITTIDKLILTHADADHMEGADEVLEEISVREIHIAPGSEKEKTMEELCGLQRNKEIPILSDEGRYFMDRKDRLLFIMWDQRWNYKGNDSSLVLFMKTTGPSFLFTGDMEEEGEQQFLATIWTS